MTTTTTDTAAMKALGFTRDDIQQTQHEAKQAGLTVPQLVRECVNETGYQHAIMATPPRPKRDGQRHLTVSTVVQSSGSPWLVREIATDGSPRWFVRLPISSEQIGEPYYFGEPYYYGPFLHEATARKFEIEAYNCIMSAVTECGNLASELHGQEITLPDGEPAWTGMPPRQRFRRAGCVSVPCA